MKEEGRAYARGSRAASVSRPRSNVDRAWGGGVKGERSHGLRYSGVHGLSALVGVRKEPFSEVILLEGFLCEHEETNAFKMKFKGRTLK